MDSLVRRAIGLDLGTSNTALALCATQGTIEGCDIVQTVTADGVGSRTLLPSVLCAPLASEHVARVPWEQSGTSSYVAGYWAREQAAILPGRAVVSSKSWLCNAMVDRRSPILPITAEDGVQRISPLEASISLLHHVRGVVQSDRDRYGEIESLPLVLTVPASFEEAARSLTLEAAHTAGFKDVTLLEEPIAALYAWFERHTGDWRSHLEVGDVILVCDVGGGTSDFSLIAVTEEGGTLSFRRLSVGEHILLGGDNMDLALAHFLRQRLEDSGQNLDQWQFLALVQGARNAKEAILSSAEMDRYAISIASRGGSLFKSAITVEVTREEILSLVVEGFLPVVSYDDLPRARRTTGLKDFGLPYAHDPAITKHLAAFLHSSARSISQSEDSKHLVRDGVIRPTKILFNGGVFGAHVFMDRVVQQVAAWFGGAAPEVLHAEGVEGAVARGAAYYGGIVSQGAGLRIRAGLGRSYYIGVEPTGLAVPGLVMKVKGICVAPQGLEEGQECHLPQQEFVLATGEEVEFRLFSATDRAGDVAGSTVRDAEGELQEGSAIKGTINADEPFVPVTLESRVTEVGALELSMKDSRDGRRWKLEFDVRSELR